MTLQQLKYITKVADCASISEASSQLFISQPSLSHSIKELEAELGFSLFLRLPKGISITTEGHIFLGYARQVLEQYQLLEEKYLGGTPLKQRFRVSSQHYSFAVQAFAELVTQYAHEEYEFAFHEGRTYEVIMEVATLKSELGLLYLNDFNRKVLGNVLDEQHVQFHPLFTSQPHIFIGRENPLAGRSSVSLEDLSPYPCLCFDQGEFNSFYYSEEILSFLPHAKVIRVSDRATIFNLMIGLNGYTISTGLLSHSLDDAQIVSIPLDVDQIIEIGYIHHRDLKPGYLATKYLERLEAVCKL
ncbi:LysR family transcriptional regulator [uncultured Sphaerochaeta sp.]|uniref:LysR family transcriptional regulator n=1 Tax=uncultured Sphaerochaeta sp. TaxID=886478 RepID=UPI002A0A1301|nr:LysR family transcriptional regulator [uncultured Sphaerochaeta sp.]